MELITETYYCSLGDIYTPASCYLGARDFPQGYSNWDWKLTTHIHLVPRLRIRGSHNLHCTKCLHGMQRENYFLSFIMYVLVRMYTYYVLSCSNTDTFVFNFQVRGDLEITRKITATETTEVEHKARTQERVVQGQVVSVKI